MPIGLVLADAEFDSEANHRHIRGVLSAHSIIPARRLRGVPEGAMRYQMYRAFPRQLYGPRAKVETVFSVIKRKLSAKAPGRSLLLQVRQALLLGLTYNLYRLRHRSALRRCQQSHLKSFVCRSYAKTGETGVHLTADPTKVRILSVIVKSSLAQTEISLTSSSGHADTIQESGWITIGGERP